MPEKLRRIPFFAGLLMLTTIAACPAKDKTASDTQTGSTASNNTPASASKPADKSSSCPTADEVTKMVGFEVRMLADQHIGDVHSCDYSNKEGGVTTIAAISAPPAQSKEELIGMRGTGPFEKISVGDNGRAYGTTERSEAETFSSGRYYHVVITNVGLRQNNDKDGAVALLKRIVGS